MCREGPRLCTVGDRCQVSNLSPPGCNPHFHLHLACTGMMCALLPSLRTEL